jgi:hypothetical protein
MGCADAMKRKSFISARLQWIPGQFRSTNIMKGMPTAGNQNQ